MYLTFSKKLFLPDRSTAAGFDIFIRGRQRTGDSSDMHGPSAAKDRKFVSRLVGGGGSVRRVPGYDLRHGQRHARLLGLRIRILRHVGCLRRHVQHRVHIKSVRHIARSIHTHQGSSQVLFCICFIVYYT